MPASDVLELAAAGDARVLLGIERVERDVHALEAGGAKLGRHLGEQRAVGGERDRLDAVDLVEPADVVDDAAAHQRLATGEADAADALLGGECGEVLDLLVGEDLGVRLPHHAVLGHAVDAAHVAAVGDRDAQVVDAGDPGRPCANSVAPVDSYGGAASRRRICGPGTLNPVEEPLLDEVGDSVGLVEAEQAHAEGVEGLVVGDDRDGLARLAHERVRALDARDLDAVAALALVALGEDEVDVVADRLGDLVERELPLSSRTMPSWVAEATTLIAAPAWRWRHESLPTTSTSSSLWAWCFTVATRQPRDVSSAMSFSRKVVLPESDLPTMETMGAVRVM